LALNCFSILVVAADPSYFNNNQQRMQAAAFCFLRLVWVAGWLWSNPQAVRRDGTIWSGGQEFVALLTYPIPYKKASMGFCYLCVW
jgi:hypothetical protein